MHARRNRTGTCGVPSNVMARAAPCPSCGAPLPRHAAFCPACGRATGVPALVVETWDDDGDEVEGPRPGVRHSAGGRRRGWLVGVGLAGGVVAAALAVSLTRHDGPRAGASPATTNTAAARTTSTTATRPSTTVASTAAPGVPSVGPVLDQPVGATLVGLVDDQSTATRFTLDLDSGATATLEVPLTSRDSRILARQGGVVLTDESAAVLLRDDGTAVTVAATEAGRPLALPGPSPDEFWLFSPGDAVPQIALHRLPSGDEVRRFELSPRSAVVGAAPDGRILVAAQDGGTFALDPDSGQATRISPGRIIALGHTVVVEDTCEANLSCAIFARKPATGARVALDRFVGPALDELSDLGLPAVLSPDERWLLAWEQGGAPFPYGVAVIDMATGRTVWQRPIEAPGFQLAAAWTPDSRWVLVKTRDGIDAVPVDAPGQVIRRLNVPGVDVSQLVTFTLVANG